MDRECGTLYGTSAELTSDFAPYRVENKLFECASMSHDVAALYALDRDMLISRARRLPLEELRGKQTTADHPPKYSELTSVARLAKLKQLVDAYYRP